ncbi:MAG: GIY-YIG nuclease family protein [Bacteroidota bacterium]|nr:MAG: GIY-YIG nuclease family protein [Bacteroidota bacterium]
MVTVYILRSKTLNKFYTGQTDNLERRMEEHNRGKTPFTKSGIPWILIYSIPLESRAEAMKLEKQIKKRGAERFLNDLGVSVG